MSDPIYIFGHRNPDADSICSALCYEDFKKRIGQDNYVAARCGNSNERIDAILGRFTTSLPIFIGDITPRVKDIMVPRSKLLTVQSDATCAEALELIDAYDIRALPVVDPKNHILGLVSVFDLGQFFIPKPNQAGVLSEIHTSVNDIIRALGARTLQLHEPERMENLCVRVAAMAVDTFARVSIKQRQPVAQNAIIVGDRVDVQKKAIEMGVRLIVIVGNLEVTDDVLELAREHQVNLIVSPYGSAATAWCIRSAVRVCEIFQQKIQSFDPQEKISLVRQQLGGQASLTHAVVDDDGQLMGVFTRTNLLQTNRHRIVLVDHNEISQAVLGAEEAEIVEIIDHHRLGNVHTPQPILFLNRPVGSTCTIIADLYRQHGLTPSSCIAGLLMGGIVSDTLNLHSPTTTPLDCELLPWLATLAGITPDALSELIFSAGSIILNASSEEAILNDCKVYEEGIYRFMVSQIEELGFANFWSSSESLQQALSHLVRKDNLHFGALLVTDINTQNSMLLMAGDPGILENISYPIVRDGIYDLQGIVSRKKQLIPYLTSLFPSE